MKVVRDQLRRDDVESVVNACDAGREGELIFTYIYEYVKAKKPVQRLWLNSMTNQAMREAFGQLRDGADLGALRDAAKSRSEADWIVGMNATRAATIRLRSSFDGAVSLGRVQTPTLAIIARREEEIRAFKPEKYWLVDAAFEADGARRYEGRFHAGAQPRLKSAAEAQAIVDAVRGDARRDHQARQDQAQGAPAAAVRPHVAAARGQHALRLQRAAHAGRRAALLRGAQGADLSAHQLALPDQRHGAGVQGDRRQGRPAPRVPRGGELRAVARPAAARARRRRRQGRRPPRDHPDQLRARPREDERRRPPDLRPRRAALPGGLPPRGRVREHARGDHRRLAHLPHARQGPARARLARRLRRAVGGRRRRATTTRGATSSSRAWSAARRSTPARSRPWRRRPSRRGATATPRCWAPWRRPASSSTTRRCARR